jgi:hypothetical protein
MTPTRFKPASGFVEEYGGGTVLVSVDRTTENYPDGRVVIVPEELWDQMLNPIEIPPRNSQMTELELRCWAIEQALRADADQTTQFADHLLSYVRPVSPVPPTG